MEGNSAVGVIAPETYTTVSTDGSISVGPLREYALILTSFAGSPLQERRVLYLQRGRAPPPEPLLSCEREPVVKELQLPVVSPGRDIAGVRWASIFRLNLSPTMPRSRENKNHRESLRGFFLTFFLRRNFRRNYGLIFFFLVHNFTLPAKLSASCAPLAGHSP